MKQFSLDQFTIKRFAFLFLRLSSNLFVFARFASFAVRSIRKSVSMASAICVYICMKLCYAACVCAYVCVYFDQFICDTDRWLSAYTSEKYRPIAISTPAPASVYLCIIAGNFFLQLSFISVDSIVSVMASIYIFYNTWLFIMNRLHSRNVAPYSTNYYFFLNVLMVL